MNKKYRIFISFSLIFLTVAACEKIKPHEEEVASVNDVSITLEEFQKEVAILSKRNPAIRITPQTLEEQLDTMIDKKLLLQEARKKGLTENEQFIETIKTFWEQTLIKELVALKTREWSERLFVTDAEIQKHYQRMQYCPLVKLVRANNKENAEEIREKMLNQLPVADEEIMGPLSVEDVRSQALLNAFDMNTGESKTCKTDDGYFVLYILKKDKTSLPPLKDISHHIKDFLLEQKRQQAMDEWLKEIKGSAKIHINASLLKEVGHEQ